MNGLHSSKMYSELRAVKFTKYMDDSKTVLSELAIT
jgi:hypothetical protein